MASYGWCGSSLNKDPSGTCPNGKRATTTPNGSEPWSPATGQTPNSEVTGTIPWMYDTTEVQMGKVPTEYQGSVLVQGGPITMPVFEAREYVNEIRGKARAKDASAEDRQAYKDLVSGLRRYTNSKLGTDDAVDNALAKVLKDASRAGVDAMDLIYGAGRKGTGEADGGSGSGKYKGPVSRVTLQAESDIESTANALALEMLGRTLNNDEIARVTKRIRTAEYAQPDVTTPTGPGGTVAQQGLTAEGRQQILRETIAKNPEFEKFQVDSTVMDATLDYIKKKRAVVDV